MDKIPFDNYQATDWEELEEAVRAAAAPPAQSAEAPPRKCGRLLRRTTRPVRLVGRRLVGRALAAAGGKRAVPHCAPTGQTLVASRREQAAPAAGRRPLDAVLGAAAEQSAAARALGLLHAGVHGGGRAPALEKTSLAEVLLLLMKTLMAIARTDMWDAAVPAINVCARVLFGVLVMRTLAHWAEPMESLSDMRRDVALACAEFVQRGPPLVSPCLLLVCRLVPFEPLALPAAPGESWREAGGWLESALPQLAARGPGRGACCAAFAQRGIICRLARCTGPISAELLPCQRLPHWGNARAALLTAFWASPAVAHLLAPEENPRCLSDIDPAWLGSRQPLLPRPPPTPPAPWPCGPAEKIGFSGTDLIETLVLSFMSPRTLRVAELTCRGWALLIYKSSVLTGRLRLAAAVRCDYLHFFQREWGAVSLRLDLVGYRMRRAYPELLRNR
eukprot:TRINITY_DN55765_c0_g1_i1.p1 TRINITY_DN55765_c0_g1~~TRINITY_DN55765_c0_g1_i1.p1  ORF type:complete len:471 (+),score=70.38 TRINITY_DN55765_c0_g1_i1:74-1414(+)